MYSQEFALTYTFLKFSSKDSISIMQNHKYIKKVVHGVQYYWLSRRPFLSDDLTLKFLPFLP